MPTIEERVAVLEANQHSTTVDVVAITAAVDLLSKQLTSEVRALSEKLSQRPSWFVTVLLTFLSSSCVGLLVAFITQTTH
jgi:hypothetical protein